jgi:hypothetical protein
MDKLLTKEEIRVVGSLIEKQLTTPDYYPLTLNALTNACNQKSNREPIVNYSEKTVIRAIDSLRIQEYVQLFRGPDTRVEKYEQSFTKRLQLTPQEVAVLCTLMLRGHQTVGELRVRAGRLYPFESIDEVQQTVERLIEQALAIGMPRQIGQKEIRYAHLLAGEPSVQQVENDPKKTPVDGQDRIEALALELMALRQEIESLKEQFRAFKLQFE